MSVRIVLLDDHVVVREAMTGLLEDAEYRIVAQAGSVRELTLALAATEFDLLITDLSLPGPNGISAISEVRRTRADRRVLVLTMYADAFRAAEAFAAGADGYAVKVEPTASILTAIREVMAGRRYLSPLVDSDAVAQLVNGRANVLAAGPLAPLSPREREIFDLLVRGHSCNDIARLLFISARTADTHRSHIFDKLGVHSTAELVRFAARFGLLDAEHAVG
jgi:DNA-binding NarL/FixJ family response regulator